MNRCAELNYFEGDLFIVSKTIRRAVVEDNKFISLKKGAIVRLVKNDRSAFPMFTIVMGFDENGADVNGLKVYIEVGEVNKLEERIDLPNDT